MLGHLLHIEKGQRNGAKSLVASKSERLHVPTMLIWLQSKCLHFLGQIDLDVFEHEEGCWFLLY